MKAISIFFIVSCHLLLCIFLYPSSHSTKKMPLTSISQTTDSSLSKGVDLLFSPSNQFIFFSGKGLTQKEKGEIYNKMDLKISHPKNELHPKEDTDWRFPVSYSITIIDLNNDKKPEVIVAGGSLEWSGQLGDEIIFTKNAAGNYFEILKGKGSFSILTSSFNGYPDLLLSGRGMTAPAYRWNGAKYQLYKTMPFGADNSPKTIPMKVYYENQLKSK